MTDQHDDLEPGETRVITQRILVYRCARCGHIGRRRTDTPPKQCAHCHHAGWRTPPRDKTPGPV